NLAGRLGGVSMGASHGVASAAGLMLAAPTAILDPAMRRSYSEQADQLRRALDNTVTSGSDWR
ncbi:MAG TPA: esterase, partial [Methylocystis sp.]|nr:esterase [Methylocystis sp.]